MANTKKQITKLPGGADPAVIRKLKIVRRKLRRDLEAEKNG